MLRKWILIAVTAATVTRCSNETQDINQTEKFRDTASLSTKVIYGNDNRRDWAEVLDENLLALADSTLGIIDKSEVSIIGETATIETRDIGLCPSEKFSNQKAGPWCSGFLVGPDLVVTAGHCVESSTHCTNLNFVFSFAKKSADHDPSVLKSSDVYNCKKLVARELTGEGPDWAIIQLDRPVEDHRPLRIRREGVITPGTPLTLIGHPSGLPSKIARDGMAHDVLRSYFKADLDSYGGNSGSAVFNAQTNEVEGILVRGRTDYTFDQQSFCRKSNFCEDGVGGSCSAQGNGLKGEHVTRISELLHLIPEVPEDDDDDETDDEDEEDETGPNTFSSKVITPIPDSSLRFIQSTIKDVPAVESIESLNIGLVVEHTYISDLSVKLISPSGNAVYLHYKTGRRVVNINGVYGVDLVSAQEIASLGPQPAGDWTVVIKDHVPYDKGRLMSWSLRL